MSVIQQIQERYAKLMAIIIALALIIFVVMLAFENGGSLFRGGNNSTIGKVNGQAIDLNDYNNKVKAQEAQMTQQGYPAGAMTTQQAQETAWNQEVYRTVMHDEAEKLGMQISKRELGDILYGANPPNDLAQNFSQNGQYNPQAAKQQIDQLLRSGTKEQKTQINDYFTQLEDARMVEKYSSLITGSIHVPKWLIEKENADKSQMAKISVVREFYSTPAIPDSSVKVSDKEIDDYISKHKTNKEFKQEESRSISYVAFTTQPTAADTAAIIKDLEQLKLTFDSTSDAAAFVAANGSSTNYADIYAGKSQMQMPNKENIQALPVTAVLGPYQDGNSFALAKMLDIKLLPDSVKSRHILIATAPTQEGEQPLSDSVAKLRIDSIELALRSGANFDSLETKYSSDKTAHQTKGEMTFSSTDLQGRVAKEYADFVLFDGKPGDKKVVKTQFGWHYIEILSLINVEPHYKVAYLSKVIEASRDTKSAALSEASKFAADSRDAKAFNANSDKLKSKGINKLFANEITPSANQVMGLGLSRDFVKNIYAADLGDVLDPQEVGENYVVALVTEVNEEGIKNAAKARQMIEPMLRNQKKGEILKQKLGKITTLEAAAAALGGKQIEFVDSLRMSGSQSSVVASEQKVIGAAFNPANRGKVVPEVILGNSGVYVIRVDNVGTIATGDINIPEQRKERAQQLQQTLGFPLQALREAANIKDYRSKFF